MALVSDNCPTVLSSFFDVFLFFLFTSSVLGVSVVSVVSSVVSVVSVVGSFNYLIETIKDCSDVLGKLFTGDFLGAIDSAKKAVVNLGKNYISVFTDMEKNGKAFFDEWEKRTLVFTNQAKVVLTSSLKDAEIVGIDTANTIKNSFDNVKDGAEEAEKALERLKQEVRDLVNNSIQLGKGISDMIFAFTTSGLNDLSIYDKEITKIQEKIDAFNKAKQSSTRPNP